MPKRICLISHKPPKPMYAALKKCVSAVHDFLLLAILVIVFCSSIARAELVKDQVLIVDGIDRTYDVYLPTYKMYGARPLVLLLHGHFGDADVMTGETRKKSPYKLWLTIAEREGWYLVIPDGERGSDNHQGWNDCRQDAGTNPTSDDVKFLRSLIDAVSSRYSINQNRIYAHGTSNGGNMVFRLAQESGEKFRAVAAVVASMPEVNKCEEPKHPVSILVMNGTEDPILPYHGGKIGRGTKDKYDRGAVMSTEDTIQYWLRNNGISTSPTIGLLSNISKRDRSRVQITRYENDKNDSEVVLYKIIGGGHTEPSLKEHYGRIYKAIIGEQNRDMEMVEEVWKFFERNR